MNFIIFNHDGSIKNVNFAEIIVQGNNLVDEIFVAVEGRSTDSYMATAYFELPNGESNFLTTTPYSHSIDQSPYNGYKFILTGAQTALYGRVRMSLKLEGIQGETLWTYEQVLTINKSGYNPDFTMITMSQYAALVQAMGSLQEKFVVNNARFYSSLANAQADLNNLAFNQCVIIADTSATDPIPEIYFKNAESQLELLAGIGEYTFQAGTTTTQTLSPGSDATVSVSFVASGKTITMNFTFGIPKGDTGATGNGIASIAKVSTIGLVDTYRITYTNGSYFDFTITNGTLAGKMVSNESFVYDSGSTYTLSEQLARFIYDLIEADKNKLKQIVAYKPNNGGPGDSYNIVWRYANSLYGGGAGNFYYLNDNDGSLITIDGHLESYKFSIFYEVDGITVADIGYFELSSSDTSGDLDDDQAQEARKTVCLIKRGNDSFHVDQEYEGGTKYFKTIPAMRVTGYKQGSIIIDNLDSNSPTWEYESEDYDMDSAPTQNSTNLVTSGGVHSAIATASSALDAKISKNAEDIATLTEALIKKDLYETQEATFMGMTAVPAGAMVKAYLDGFKGNSAVVNQLVNLFTNYPTQVSISSNMLTATLLVSGLVTYVKPRVEFQKGHKYLIHRTISGNFTELNYWHNSDYDSVTRLLEVGEYSFIDFTKSNGSNGTLTLGGDVGSSVTLNVIDLTIVPLTSAEMADVPTAKAALKHKDMDVDSYIPYNAGTLTDSKPTKLISYGYNLFDGVLSRGAFNYQTGQPNDDANSSRSDYIEVYPSTAFAWEEANYSTYNSKQVFEYDKDKNYLGYAGVYTAGKYTFTTKPQTKFIRLRYLEYDAPVPTSSAKISVHLNSADLGYKPYVPPIEYDLTMPALKSAGSVQDESKAGGSKVKQDSLATIKSGGFAAYGGYLVPFVYAGTKSVSENPNLLCDKYQTVNGVYANTSYTDDVPDKSITVIVNSNNLFVKDSALGSIDNLVGTLLSPKATPTDFSDPISYPEIFDVREGGSIEIVGDGCDATTKVYFYVEA